MGGVKFLLFQVTSSGFAPLSTAEGEGLHRAVLGREAKFSVLVKDHLGEQTMVSEEQLQVRNLSLVFDASTIHCKVSILSPDQRPVTWKVLPDASHVGKYSVKWRPHIEGEHVIQVGGSYISAFLMS